MTIIQKGLALQEEAKRRIPGLTQLLSKRPDRFAPGVWPGYFQRAQGAMVWDLDGNEFVDMSLGGIGANVLGYADPDVDAAVCSAIAAGTSCSLNCPEEVELAELLCDLHPWADMVRYARCGGEAMAVAVRIARAATGRDKLAFCGYHGWHDWYLAANIESDNALGEHLIEGLEPLGVPKALAGTAIPFRYNNLEELQVIVERFGSDLAAVVMEPIRSARPEDGFLEGVRDLAHSCGSALVFDEISAAFRLCSGGAHLTLGIEPDIAVFAKAMSNGYPMASVIGRAEVMEAAQNSFISSTYWTDRIGPVAALATIRKHKAVNAGPHLVRIGEAVQDGWRHLADKHGIQVHVGGIPPLAHFSFEVEKPLHARSYFVQLMLDRGYLAGGSFYSMFVHNDEHVQGYMEAADQAFGMVAKAAAEDSFDRFMRGGPAQAGFGRLA